MKFIALALLGVAFFQSVEAKTIRDYPQSVLKFLGVVKGDPDEPRLFEWQYHGKLVNGYEIVSFSRGNYALRQDPKNFCVKALMDGEIIDILPESNQVFVRIKKSFHSFIHEVARTNPQIKGLLSVFQHRKVVGYDSPHSYGLGLYTVTLEDAFCDSWTAKLISFTPQTSEAILDCKEYHPEEYKDLVKKIIESSKYNYSDWIPLSSVCDEVEGLGKYYNNLDKPYIIADEEESINTMTFYQFSISFGTFIQNLSDLYPSIQARQIDKNLAQEGLYQNVRTTLELTEQHQVDKIQSIEMWIYPHENELGLYSTCDEKGLTLNGACSIIAAKNQLGNEYIQGEKLESFCNEVLDLLEIYRRPN